MVLFSASSESVNGAYMVTVRYVVSGASPSRPYVMDAPLCPFIRYQIPSGSCMVGFQVDHICQNIRIYIVVFTARARSKEVRKDKITTFLMFIIFFFRVDCNIHPLR